MPYILSDVPSIIRCLVRAEFTQNHQRGHGTYLKAHILGIRCQEAASLQFQVRFDEPSIAGAMFCLPIQALCWKPCDMPDVELVQPWDTFSSDFTVHEFGLWKRGNAQLLNVRGIEPWPERLDARYLFTVDFTGNALTNDPEQRKNLHFLQVNEGWYAAVPNNRVISVDEAFEKPCAELPRFESLEYLYAAECRIGEPKADTQGQSDFIESSSNEALSQTIDWTKPVQTKETPPRPAEILIVTQSLTYPVRGLIGDLHFAWTADGHYIAGEESPFDLENVPETTKPE